MHFITKKTSATGKKFQAISEKADAVLKADKAVAKEIGFEQWRGGYWLVWGGFSSLIFKDKPDEKVFKKVNGNEWLPRMNTKAGKEIQAKLDATPRVTIDELNQCIGFDGAPFKTIGFAQNNKEYFGFIVDEKWNVKIPKDCEEVTVSKYNELFKSVGRKGLIMAFRTLNSILIKAVSITYTCCCAIVLMLHNGLAMNSKTLIERGV